MFIQLHVNVILTQKFSRIHATEFVLISKSFSRIEIVQCKYGKINFNLAQIATKDFIVVNVTI